MQPAGGGGHEGGGEAVSFAAHQDQCPESVQGGGADVISVEGGGVDGDSGGGASAHKRMKVAGDGPLAEDGAHGGLDGLGVVQVDAVGREVDGADAEPIGQAQDGADVPRVADGVQSEAEALGKLRIRRVSAVPISVRDAQHGKGRGGGGEKAHASHELFSDVCGTVDRFNGKTLLSQGLPDHFLPFDDEKPVLLPELLLSEGADKPDVGLRGYTVGKHCPAELPSISQDLEHRLVGLLLAEELGGIVPVRCLVDDDMLGSGLEAVLDAAIAGY